MSTDTAFHRHGQPCEIPADAPGFRVVCADGKTRHPEPFATRAEACEFLEWGHACLAAHVILNLALPEFAGEHVTTVTAQKDGANFQVTCVCGYSCGVASLRRQHAEQNADRHKRSFDQPDDPFEGL